MRRLNLPVCVGQLQAVEDRIGSRRNAPQVRKTYPTLVSTDAQPLRIGIHVEPYPIVIARPHLIKIRDIVQSTVVAENTLALKVCRPRELVAQRPLRRFQVVRSHVRDRARAVSQFSRQSLTRSSE